MFSPTTLTLPAATTSSPPVVIATVVAAAVVVSLMTLMHGIDARHRPDTHDADHIDLRRATPPAVFRAVAGLHGVRILRQRIADQVAHPDNDRVYPHSGDGRDDPDPDSAPPAAGPTAGGRP